MTLRKGKILVTGGTGYIGSHLLVRLIERGYDVIALDNLSNSHLESLNRVRELTQYKVPFIQVDLTTDNLVALFRKPQNPNSSTNFNENSSSAAGFLADVTGIIHCAGLKAVGQSSVDPLLYYHHNVLGTLRLLQALQDTLLAPSEESSSRYHPSFPFIFSSSAMVYGHAKIIPIPEDHPCAPNSPYGMTKYAIEQMLQNFADSILKRSLDATEDLKKPRLFQCINLRYFNPVGAHPSGRLGEHPQGIPNNLFPFLGQIAMNQQPCLSVYGNDWETIDGTGVRDYIHIMDLVDGHIDALRYLESSDQQNLLKNASPPCERINLGLGQGYSVLQIIEAFENVSAQKIPYKFTLRRYGDVATLVAKPTKAQELLQWTPKCTLEHICQDFLRWLCMNPQGYI